jgi:nitrogen fixation protein FixH
MKINMNWGKSILLAFILFISFVGYLAYKMATSKVDLVRSNYYQNELEYQKQIEKIKNSKQFNPKDIMNYSAENEEFTMNFPHQVKSGEVNFYRSSDNNLDVKFPIKNTKTFNYSTKNLKHGHWKVQVNWTDGALDYFVENEFIKN